MKSPNPCRSRSDRTWIKMCGITRARDARAAVEAGANALGFVFADSPRRISPEAAREIVAELPPHVLRFGVFVDTAPREIARAVGVSRVDRVQLHGFAERPEGNAMQDVRGRSHGPDGLAVVPAFRAKDSSVLREIEQSGSEFFLLDSYSPTRAGGTGKTFDWSLARQAAKLGRLVLAGGLLVDNVGEAIRSVRPFGVDVSSGVESSPGIKDPDRIRAFVSAVREADAELAALEAKAG